MFRESGQRQFKIFALLLMFFILCSYPVSTFAEGSVREMMEQEVTSLSCLYDFYAKHTSPYERRYFMQYAPEYLTKFGVADAPLWLTLALDSALGFIRKLVAQRINLRLAPEIIFRADKSSEYSVRIQEVLEEIKEINEPKKSHRLHKKA